MLGIITLSDKRKRLLLLLQTGSKTIEEIKQALNVTATGMLPQIRILEERNLVTREGREYALTAIGKVIVTYLDPLVKILEVFEKHEKFWQEHDVGAIPPRLFARLNELGNTQLVERSIEELYEPQKDFLESIMNSKKIKCIYPLVHPTYPKLFLQLAENGTDISIILTRKAFNKLKNEHNGLLSQVLSFNNTSLYISDEDIKVISVVTDIFFSMSLFFKKSIFDSRSDLTSSDKSALLWGEELFNYYKEQSERIESLQVTLG